MTAKHAAMRPLRKRLLAGMSSDNSLWQRMSVLAVLRQLFGKAEIVHFFFTTYDLRQVRSVKISCISNVSMLYCVNYKYCQISIGSIVQASACGTAFICHHK